MPTSVGVLLRLSKQDYELLAAVARRAGASRSQVLRWALRHYVHLGPWTTHDAWREGVAALPHDRTTGPEWAQEVTDEEEA